MSHEREPLAILRDALADIPVECVSGQGGRNRFGIDGWELSSLQQFQFGDLRIEVPGATVLVEAESAGGVGNLVKYWPLLRAGTLEKRLILIHLFMVGSAGDYIAHRKLWSFLVDRMTLDLESVGVARPADWDAQAFTYRKGDRLEGVTVVLRRIVTDALNSP